MTDQETINQIIDQVAGQLFPQSDLSGTVTETDESRLQAEGDKATRIAGMIDHTLLKPEASQNQIVELCSQARAYHFASVCINPTHVRLAAQSLKGSGVPVCTVIGFPLGATTTPVKVYETQQAIHHGAREVDMVINLGSLKSQDYETVYEDILAVVHAARAAGALVKVIIEAALLTDEEKVVACYLAKTAAADYVKTSTGFGPGGATADDVKLIRQVVGPDMGVKAAGGISSYDDAQAMIAAGATRIGASAGVKIVSQANE